jgi:predicted dehydrogenase
MPENSFKTVIIGAGDISNFHAAALKKSSQFSLAACWNRIEERELGLAFAEKHGVKYYSSLDEMLETEQPAVTVNVLCPKYHILGLEKAVSVGSHLVVEKPMALSIAECRRIMEIASRSNVMLSVSESSAFNNVTMTFATLRNRLGSPIQILDTNYRYYFSPDRKPWIFCPDEGFGGMIMNVGVHRIAKMRIFAGAPESSICATVGARDCGRPVEGDATMLIRYANGATGVVLMCGYHNPGPNGMNVTRIVTDKGYIIPGETIRFTRADGIEDSIPVSEGLDQDEYANFYKSLAEALLLKEKSPYSGMDGMRDVAVIHAAFKSFKEGREVKIDEVLF